MQLTCVEECLLASPCSPVFLHMHEGNIGLNGARVSVVRLCVFVFGFLCVHVSCVCVCVCFGGCVRVCAWCVH